MKKILLSAFVIGLFIINGLARQEEAVSPPITYPTSRPQVTNTAATPSPVSNLSSQPSPTQTPSQASGAGSSPQQVAQQGQYKNGTYTGGVADAFYGNVQVQATISGGKLTDVQFLQYPNDRSTSIAINTQAMPYLKQEALQAQSANVQGISGASDTSAAFQQSLASALAQAH